MKPDELKQWRQRLSLGEVGMAAYLGVPVTTYRKWENGTRSQDASTRRLFEVLQMIEDAQESPGGMHDELVSRARYLAWVMKDDAPKRRGRRPKAPATPPAPAAQGDIPAWLMNSHP